MTTSQRRNIRTFVVCLSVTLVVCLFFIWVENSKAHYVPGQHNVYHASLKAWCGGNNVVCSEGEHAYRVASCETGGTFDLWASNGQYKGLWQMGAHERATCGQTWGRNPWAQARAALCWLRKTSWGSSWTECG